MGDLRELVLDIAKKLISTPSLSGSEGDVAKVIRDLVAGLGVDKVFIDRYGSVVAVIKGSIQGSIVFEGHMDHVPPGSLENWHVDPYEPRVIDDMLYGRGSVDMKGAIASMIASITLIRERDTPTIYYIFVPYEEIAEGVVLKYTMEDTLDNLRPQLVVLGEATNLNMHVGQRGRAVIYIDIHGLSAHASMPDQGINPLTGAGVLITMIRELSAKLPTHPILGKSTIVPTIIECTPKSPPMIPDSCRIVVDRRFVVGETEDKILGEVRELTNKIINGGLARKCNVYIPDEEAIMWTGTKIKIHHYYPAWLNEDRSLIDRAKLILENSLGISIGVGVWRFSTDGVYTAGIAKIPTIGFGPGDERLAHKPDEHVPVKHLELAAIGYAQLVNLAK